MTRYIYICGSGYSGSTLLDLILGSHPCAVSLGETKNLVRNIIENRQCTCKQPVKACAFWNSMRQKVILDRGIDIFLRPADFPTSLTTNQDTLLERVIRYQRLALAVPGQKFLTYLELTPGGVSSARTILQNVFYLYDTVSDVTGCKVVVDSSKSPVDMKWLWMTRPSQLKVLHIVRDGRAVLASYRRRGWSAERAVWNWVRTESSVRRMLWTMPKSAWMLVRYEDICNNPKRELRRICEFLCLEFTDEMLDFRKHTHHDISGNPMRLESSNQIVNPETWRQQLSRVDLDIFDRLAGSTNRRLGYLG